MGFGREFGLEEAQPFVLDALAVVNHVHDRFRPLYAETNLNVHLLTRTRLERI